MTGVPAIRRYSLDQRALDLVLHLEKVGTEGSPRESICADLGWTNSQFESALAVARDRLGPELSVTIPHPVPSDGWRYRVTGQWLHEDNTPAIEAGTSYALGIIEARLRAVLRDVRIAKGSLDPRSVSGRKCNFVDKHLTHIVSTLGEIGPSTGQPDDNPFRP